MEILIGLAVAILFAVLLYNFLVSRKNQVDNISASVDALLKKRYDLIPNLVASVKEYMEYEKDLLEKVTKLRSKALDRNLDEIQKIETDQEISKLLGDIFVAVENYPELKADKNILHLQHTLNEIEEQISAARRAYNQAVTDYNNAIEMFPTNILAKYMGYKRKALFQIDKNQRKSVDVKNLFKS